MSYLIRNHFTRQIYYTSNCWLNSSMPIIYRREEKMNNYFNKY